MCSFDQIPTSLIGRETLPQVHLFERGTKMCAVSIGDDPFNRPPPEFSEVKRHTIWPCKRHLLVFGIAGEDFRRVYTHWDSESKSMVLCTATPCKPCPRCDRPARSYCYAEAWLWNGSGFRDAQSVMGSRICEIATVTPALWKPVVLELPDSGSDLTLFADRGSAWLLWRKNDKDNGSILWQRIDQKFKLPTQPAGYLREWLHNHYLATKGEYNG